MTNRFDNPYYVGRYINHEQKSVDDMEGDLIVNDCDNLAFICHSIAATSGWWNAPDGSSLLKTRNVGEMLMLMVSELAEAMEADRKSLMDDKLPHRLGLEVELADCLIRIFDFAGAYGLDVGGAIVEKLRFNLEREDHKPENRFKEGGKKY